MALIKLADAIKYLKDPDNRNKKIDIKYKKKDGSIRPAEAIFGHNNGALVHNPLNPGVNFAKHGLISYYEPKIEKYRCFSEKALLGLMIDGKWHDIEEAHIMTITI